MWKITEWLTPEEVWVCMEWENGSPRMKFWVEVGCEESWRFQKNGALWKIRDKFKESYMLGLFE